jgi:phage baseplate assembly protein W
MTKADETDVEMIVLGSYSDTELEDISRCLCTLYGSMAGEQGLDRDFGLSTDFLDQSSESAQVLYTAEVVRKTALYEPRARVTRVEYTGDKEGRLKPKVVVELV